MNREESKKAPRGGFWRRYLEYRRAFGTERSEIDPDEIFGDLREKSSGRGDVDWKLASAAGSSSEP